MREFPRLTGIRRADLAVARSWYRQYHDIDLDDEVLADVIDDVMARRMELGMSASAAPSAHAIHLSENGSV